MGLLDGKIALVFGVANKDSIGWGIAKRLHQEGATILFSYAAAALEKRVRPLAAEVGSDFVELCDVSDDAQLDAVFEKVKERYGRIDVLVHSVAFAPREDLGGRFLDISREGFKVALDVSAYSLVAMCKRAEPLMQPGSTVLSLTYNASQRVMPKYNVMAVAKSALENISRYLAADLGPKGIRVNVISAGPIKTLAAMGVPGIHAMLRFNERTSPLRSNVTQDDVGKTAVYLASDLSTGVTGEIIYVDCGYNILGLTATEEEIAQF